MQSMRAAFKQLLTLTMVLFCVPWAQSGICPMVLLAPSNTCASHAKSEQTRATGSHSCCPGHAIKHAATSQAAAGNSTMSCCSVDSQPASTGKVTVVSTANAEVSDVDLDVSRASAHRIVAPDRLSSFKFPVFRLKTDLRI